MTKRIFIWAVAPIVVVVLLIWEAPVAFGKKVVLFSEVNGERVFDLNRSIDNVVSSALHSVKAYITKPFSL